jgi:hypothetical protein
LDTFRRRRIAGAVLLTPVVAALTTIFLTFRMSLATGSRLDYELRFSWVVGLAVALLFGTIHALKSKRRGIFVDARVILAGADLGIPLTTLSYRALSDDLVVIVEGLQASVVESDELVVLLGMLDGLLYGVLVGAFVSILNRRRADAGVARYALLFLIGFALFAFSIALESVWVPDDRFHGLLVLVLFLVVDVGVGIWDGRSGAR